MERRRKATREQRRRYYSTVYLHINVKEYCIYLVGFHLVKGLYELSVRAGVELSSVFVGILYDLCFKIVTLSKK